jgi:hypothetical protein
MALPLIGSLRDVLRAQADESTGRAATVLARALLAAAATALVVSSGLVALAGVIGYPYAALVFALVFAILALAIPSLMKRRTLRRSAELAIARNRAEADVALAAALLRSARPFLPIAVFLAAFSLARRL